MKKIYNKENSKSVVLCLAGLAAAAVVVIKNITYSKHKIEKSEEMFNLVQTTRELENNSNGDKKIRKYIETVDNIDLNISNLWIIKEGYDLILKDKNISDDLKNDLKLILEMKGVNIGYKR